MSNKQFWINVDLESAEMHIKLETVLDICHEIYLWALDTTAEIWINEKEIPKAGSFSKILTAKINNNGRYRRVQRYTLNRVIESAIHQFRNGLSIEEDRIGFPKPIQRDEYTSFVIPSRGIWKKYLEEYSRISTTYGMIYMDLEKEWIKTMQAQAKHHKVTMDYFPYLWHSVTVQKKEDGWKIHFNLHEVGSHKGKIAERKAKRERFKAL